MNGDGRAGVGVGEVHLVEVGDDFLLRIGVSDRGGEDYGGERLDLAVGSICETRNKHLVESLEGVKYCR